MHLISKKFTHINQMEMFTFRVMKPFGWILFAMAIIPFFVFMGFFITNLIQYLNLVQLLPSNTNSDPTWYQENVVNIINNVVFYLQALGINVLVLLGLRLIMKILMILRTVNQYISCAYKTYHNLPKLVVTLAILLIGMCFIFVLIVATFMLFFWLNDIFVNSSNIIKENNDYNAIRELLILDIDKINHYHLKEQTTFILLIFGAGGWLLTSITYFFYIIYFIPKHFEFVDEEWKFEKMYNQMKANKNKREFAPSSSYNEYSNRMTNGFSHRNNPRDKQYEIYESKHKSKK